MGSVLLVSSPEHFGLLIRSGDLKSLRRDRAGKAWAGRRLLLLRPWGHRGRSRPESPVFLVGDMTGLHGDVDPAGQDDKAQGSKEEAEGKPDHNSQNSQQPVKSCLGGGWIPGRFRECGLPFGLGFSSTGALGLLRLLLLPAAGLRDVGDAGSRNGERGANLPAGGFCDPRPLPAEAGGDAGLADSHPERAEIF